jgi:hypothetical protein
MDSKPNQGSIGLLIARVYEPVTVPVGGFFGLTDSEVVLKFRLLIGLALGFLRIASADPVCVNGTLASYELLGSAGCSIGGNTVASFAVVTGITGAVPIDPASVNVMPTGGTLNPALVFETDQQAGAGTLLEAIFTYTIASGVYGADMITLSGSSETGDGAVTDTQNFCAGGNFGPDGVTGCSGSTSGALLTLDGVQNEDQTTLPGSNLLSITDDFVLDGGTFGSASGGTFADRFNVTPEPASVVLLGGTGLLLIGLRKLRSQIRNS